MASDLDARVLGRSGSDWPKEPSMSAMILPGLPAWNHLHPLVVHFPIALLMIAPLFVLGGVIVGAGKGRPYLIAAFLLMLMGTAATFVAGASGDAAGEAARKTPVIERVLEQHEEMAETTQIVFSVLTVVFAGFLFLPALIKRESPAAFARTVPALFLFVYLGGIGALVNTAHNGGRLVHELGIHSVPGAPGMAKSSGPEAERE